MIQLAQANAVRIPLRDGVVSLVVTSPPYWGLRSYQGEQTFVWGGEAECRHVWGDEGKTMTGRNDNGRPEKGRGWAEYDIERNASTGQFCQRCTAWRGALGLEPTPDLFIEHLVEVFREVRRVLSDDGLCMVNIGDSYASQGGDLSKKRDINTGNARANEFMRPGSRKAPHNLKPKDLCLIPQRLAIALQRDGWYVRSFMPWVKNNCLPESVRDRPTTAHEYWIMLAKSRRYFWDQEAVRVKFTDDRMGNPGGGGNYMRTLYPENKHAQSGLKSGNWTNGENLSGRNRRTSDTWLDGLDEMIAEQRRYLAHLEAIRDGTGMLVSRDGEPLGVRFNTASYAGSHFATYPAQMIEPFVKAGSSERGCCQVCRKAWVRVVDRKLIDRDGRGAAKKDHTGNLLGAQSMIRDGDGRAGTSVVTTIGWRATCDHAAEPIPALVLDPFVGTGTTLEVARALGRDAIGFDLSRPYLRDHARERLLLTALAEWWDGIDASADGQLDGLPMFDGLGE